MAPTRSVRLRPIVNRDDAEIADLDISRIDDDPITYFLTPTPPASDEIMADMDFEMEFDAGIEDAKHPPLIVRSVSPSSLEGLSLPPPRVPTPPRRSVSPDVDRDMPPTPEDHEDYIYLAGRGRSQPFGLPFSLRDFAASKLKPKGTQEDHGQEFLFPPPSIQNTSGGRPGQRVPRTSQGAIVRRGRTRSVSLRRSPHAWREPSPDVWSIEEETEGELNSEMGDSTMEGYDPELNSKGIDIPAAKPKKRVRFVLPGSTEELGAF
ncbi:hypothetical protein QBC47DRAFT_356107 [Echria macrotheca]|uniref:Uncharacterized protein n=1 Tax=Echria macrotheca TaxID=438768 RepID=A0AAJ0FF45_9PEZI|nr:hypothetical protein QBC47DRAFT_356107 [Echria macrotheca]